MPKAALIDLDGVVYTGDDAVPGAADAIAWLMDQGIPHLFVTNTTSRPRAGLVEGLGRLGIETGTERIHTPAVAAATWLASNAPGPAALLVPESLTGEFDALDRLPDEAESGAASVVIGDLGEDWDYGTLNRAFRLLMADPPPVLAALGMTRYWKAGDGMRIDIGAFVKALEYAASCDAVVLGKPGRDFFDAALARVECAAGDAVMIGDDVVGDVQGAQDAGIEGVLVRTGKFRESDLEGGVRPDAVLDSLADLPAWWRGDG